MKKAWFKPKLFGLGASIPCSWEGWLVLAAFIGSVFGGLWLGRQFEAPAIRALLPLAVLAIASLVFIPLIASRTQGGWKWRWGRRDR